MSKLSIIIPSRKEKFLQNTIDDILIKAEGDVEIIVILDGYWTLPPLKDDDRLKIIHFGDAKGMRSAINAGVKVATGKYIMKCDAHCMFDKGFDATLIKYNKNKQVQIPTRKRLDPYNWKLREDERPDINYLLLNAEYKGVNNNVMNRDAELAKKKVDEIEAFQGSCWFMEKYLYEKCGFLDEKNFGEMGHESQEIYFKIKNIGGKVVRNKNTWYAHWHKDTNSFHSDRTKSREYIKEYVRNMENIKKEKFKRRNLAKMFSGKGAEIGVRTGKFSEIICQEGKNIELLSVDPYDLPYRDIRSERIGIEKQLDFYDEAVKRLEPYNCKVIKKESLDFVGEIEYESLDFVYIDGCHEFDYVMCDIIEWAKRVKIGGIISGHDYYGFRNADVVEAVDIYCKIHNIEFNLTDERTPSWWFNKK